MYKNCFNPNAFIQIFKLILKMFIMNIDSFKKAKRNNILIKSINIINEFLLVGKKFMLEMHSRHSAFT